MPEIRVAAAAEEDLRKVWEYVAQNNPEAAGKLIKEITRKFAVLRDFPQMGREQTRLLIGLRVMVSTSSDKGELSDSSRDEPVQYYCWRARH